MKKLLILLAISSSVLAKFPHENDSKTIGGKNTDKSKFLKSIKKIDSMELDHTEGKILAAMYNMKENKISDLKQDVLELMTRTSTVEKLNTENANPINVENFISELKRLDTILDQINLDAIDFKDIEVLEAEVESKAIEFEALIGDLD